MGFGRPGSDAPDPGSAGCNTVRQEHAIAVLDSSSVSFSRGDVASFDGRDASRTLVRLRGEHDASTEAALSEILALAIALDAADVVVDLSEVEFMGAATVGVMARTRELLRSRSRTLELRAPSACAQRVLHACGLDLLDLSSSVT
jgi:anti-anti-sigma factor